MMRIMMRRYDDDDYLRPKHPDIPANWQHSSMLRVDQIDFKMMYQIPVFSTDCDT